MTISPQSGLPLSVLFAPAHHALDADYGGSEYYWAYALISTLGFQFGLRGYAVTGTLIGSPTFPSTIHVHQIRSSKPPDMSILGSIRFTLSYSAVIARTLSQQHFDIMHHVLPFRINRTINLPAVMQKSSRIPFVIGPVQIPLGYDDLDAVNVVARRFESLHISIKKKSVGDNLLLLLSPLLRALSTATLRRANAVIAVNNSARAIYSKYVAPERIRVIPPGIDTVRFRVKALRDSHEPIRVLSCGYLIRRKRFDMLLRAFARLARRWKRIELWIIGDGPQRSQLERMASNLKIADYVRFLGFIPHNQIHQYYEEVDIYCTTSRAESFGQTILEAMAAGLPVIATRTTGASELVRHEETGLLVDEEDEIGVSEALERLIVDRESAVTFGHRAREIAEKYYDWREIAKQYFSLYNQLLHRQNNCFL